MVSATNSTTGIIGNTQSTFPEKLKCCILNILHIVFILVIQRTATIKLAMCITRNTLVEPPIHDDDSGDAILLFLIAMSGV